MPKSFEFSIYGSYERERVVFRLPVATSVSEWFFDYRLNITRRRY